MEKARGMLLGIHVGDALGASLEGLEPQNQASFQIEITGGGPLDRPCGAASDITDLNLCLLESLVECQGLDIANLRDKFVAWFEQGPISLGNTESSAFYSMKIGLDPHECGLLRDGKGALVRCAPLSLFYADLSLKEASEVYTNMTHTGEVCKVSSYLFLKALQMALQGIPKLTILENLTKEAEGLHLLIFDKLAKIPKLNWEDLETSSYVLDTLNAALWGLIHTDSFEQAMLMIANKGDDSRACSAVTGALCGAYYGADAIPQKWLKKIRKKDQITNLLDQLNVKKP